MYVCMNVCMNVCVYLCICPSRIISGENDAAVRDGDLCEGDMEMPTVQVCVSQTDREACSDSRLLFSLRILGLPRRRKGEEALRAEDQGEEVQV